MCDNTKKEILLLHIEDNRIESKGNQHKGLGLIYIKERLKIWAGRFETCLNVTLGTEFINGILTDSTTYSGKRK